MTPYRQKVLAMPCHAPKDANFNQTTSFRSGHKQAQNAAAAIAAAADSEITELAAKLRECAPDAARLEWLMANVNGKELRRLGIKHSAGCSRSDIDQARQSPKNTNQAAGESGDGSSRSESARL